MGRFDRPEELAAHLTQIAGIWNELLPDLDASGIQIFGRIDAVARNWMALQREVLTPFGINYAELTTLGILRTTTPTPRRSPTELRGLVGQTSAGMTRILDKLEAEGLARRESAPDDGRRVDIVLSQSGKRLVEVAFRALLVPQNELLESLDPRHIEVTIGALDSLLAAFDRRRP